MALKGAEVLGGAPVSTPPPEVELEELLAELLELELLDELEDALEEELEPDEGFPSPPLELEEPSTFSDAPLHATKKHRPVKAQIFSKALTVFES